MANMEERIIDKLRVPELELHQEIQGLEKEIVESEKWTVKTWKEMAYQSIIPASALASFAASVFILPETRVPIVDSAILGSVWMLHLGTGYLDDLYYSTGYLAETISKRAIRYWKDSKLKKLLGH